jgi:hypothetical protein
MSPRFRILLRRLACIAPVGMMSAALAGAPPSPPVPQFTRAQTNYILGCGGCHGENGITNSRLVPDLRDQVGYFLNTPQGREYLVRLPNVAFSTLSDADLAEVLNFMVFTLGGTSVPAKAAAYTPAEVAPLRRRPLNEVRLLEYRARLVDNLIAQHGASLRLRVYGGAHY